METSPALSFVLAVQCAGRAIGAITVADGVRDLPVNREPVVATWELWTVAKMLISAHGDDAEAHAAEKLADAQKRQHEGDEIIWQGIITQLSRIRAGERA